jgi:hypothetical protein
MWASILRKFNKVPNHYECVWSICSTCGANKGEPCRKLWRCEERIHDIKAALNFDKKAHWAAVEARMKETQFRELKQAVKEWT